MRQQRIDAGESDADGDDALSFAGAITDTHASANTIANTDDLGRHVER